MTRFTVHSGKRYAARIELPFFEAIGASNDDIADRFTAAGFKEVHVTGTGTERIAHGLWAGEDASAELPSQITEVKELTA